MRHSSFKLVKSEYIELIWQGVSRYYRTSYYLNKNDGTIEDRELTRDTFEKHRKEDKKVVKIYDVEDEFLKIDNFLLAKFLSVEKNIDEIEAREVIRTAKESVYSLREGSKLRLSIYKEYKIFENVIDLKIKDLEVRIK